jgi:hypothetical protein
MWGAHQPLEEVDDAPDSIACWMNDRWTELDLFMCSVLPGSPSTYSPSFWRSTGNLMTQCNSVSVALVIILLLQQIVTLGVVLGLQSLHKIEVLRGRRAFCLASFA